jgi:8-oxo-dGTP pyrophosphatase MutT (NUDIX family)
VIELAILATIRARLDRAQALPSIGYRPFVVAGIAVGQIDDARAARLARFGSLLFDVRAGAVTLCDRLATEQSRSAALADVARTLRAEGALPAWRDERYAIATEFGAPPLFHLERGAARYFGVRTFAAHVNGVVPDDNGTRMWFARRSASKAVDPGLLDNLVGGGIAAGLSVRETVIKEAWEEAGIDARLASQAIPAGIVHVQRAMFDGLQRETVFVHDLSLSRRFVPANQDGEATEHRLVTLAEAARLVATGDGADEVTVDASAVVLDYLTRQRE